MTALPTASPLTRPHADPIPQQAAPDFRISADTGAAPGLVDLALARTDQRDGRVVTAQRHRLDRNARALGRLMERRPELRGAYAPADLALEAMIAGI